jgi:hypothetical protein
MRIGLVDLDTSHPENWIPLERELGHTVAGAWDGGSVHPPQYVRDFARRLDIPRLYDSLEQMADEVDCAILHGCDWDTHLAKAQPFIERGKSVLLDKPLAGSVRDLNQIRQWAKAGARITGGSSLRFCEEARAFLARDPQERGTPHTVLCGCGVDEFNYGIHAYSLLCGLMGPGLRSVRHLGQGVQRRIQLNWADGRMGLLVIGPAAAWLPFYASITTERTVTQFQPDAGRLYRALLENCLPYLAGQTAQPPVPIDDLIEAELAALAALKSWSNGDVEVPLASLNEADNGYDGAAFAAEYRALKYPPSKE